MVDGGGSAFGRGACPVVGPALLRTDTTGSTDIFVIVIVIVASYGLERSLQPLEFA